MISEPLTAMMACPADDGAACAIVASEEWVRRHQPDRKVVRPIASALQSESYSPGHTFLGPVVGPASMTARTAQLAYDGRRRRPRRHPRGVLPRRLRQRGARVLRAAGVLRAGEGSGCWRRATRRSAAASRSTPTVASSPGATRGPHGPGHGPRGRHPAPRRGRRPSGHRRQAGPGPPGGWRQRLHRQHLRDRVRGTLMDDDELLARGPRADPGAAGLAVAQGAWGSVPRAPSWHRTSSPTCRDVGLRDALVAARTSPSGIRQPGHVRLAGGPRPDRGGSRPTSAAPSRLGITQDRARRGDDADGHLRRRPRRQRRPPHRRRGLRGHLTQ